MRKALFALLPLISILIYPHSAHADTVTFSVSVVGSGAIGSDTFTDQRVTFTAFAPEEVFDEAFMEMCSEMVVIKLEGWERSSGIKREIEFFTARKKPIRYMDPPSSISSHQ